MALSLLIIVFTVLLPGCAHLTNKSSGNTTKIKTYNPDPPYNMFKSYGMSLGARAGDMLRLTGQVGVNDDGSFPKDYETQLINTFRHLDSVVKAAGADWNNVVQFRSYHVGADAEEKQFPKLLEMNKKYMPLGQFAWTGIIVPQLIPRESLIEIDIEIYMGD